jgi:hypothetical protein
MLVYCHDVVVQKISPDGHTLYTRTLGGESDQLPRQFVIDAQDNVVLFGTTYSKQFPTTPDAVQLTFAGPAAAFSTSGSTPEAGGDIFLSILAPSGGLLYSTFLGSSGNDRVLGVRAVSNAQVDGRRLRAGFAGHGDARRGWPFPHVPGQPVRPSGRHRGANPLGRAR